MDGCALAAHTKRNLKRVKFGASFDIQIVQNTAKVFLYTLCAHIYTECARASTFKMLVLCLTLTLTSVGLIRLNLVCVCVCVMCLLNRASEWWINVWYDSPIMSSNKFYECVTRVWCGIEENCVFGVFDLTWIGEVHIRSKKQAYSGIAYRLGWKVIKIVCDAHRFINMVCKVEWFECIQRRINKLTNINQHNLTV